MAVAFSANQCTISGTESSWGTIQTALAAVAVVARSTAYSVGNVRKIKSTADQALWVRCTTSGTTSGTEPTWPTATATTVTDGTVVWTTITAPYRTLSGDLYVYVMHEWVIIITGATTIADPSKEYPQCARMWIRSGGTLTSGALLAAAGYTTTPKTDGVHFQCMDSTVLNFADSEAAAAWSIASGGNCVLRGGAVITPGALYVQYTSAVSRGQLTATGVKFVASKAHTTSSTRIRCWSPDVTLTNCTFYDFAMDLFRVPTNAPSVQARASEYVFEYIGSWAGGADARFVCSALENPDGVYDFDNWGGGWVEIFNCARGASLNVVSQGANADKLTTCVPLWQDINLAFTDLAGTAQAGVKWRSVESPTNSPTRTITVRGSLKTWDFQNAATYTGTSDAGGLSSTSLPLQVYWYTTGYVLTKSLRFPASTATIRSCGYYVMQQDTSIVLGSNAAISKTVAQPAAVNLALSEAAADALTGFTFTPSGATGGTATIASGKTASDTWCKWRTFKRDNLGSNDSWSYDGTILGIGAWSFNASAGTFTGGMTVGAGTLTGAMTTGGAYTYTGGTLTVSTATPILVGGTINIGAAGTYGFCGNGTIVSMTPTAPGTYTLIGTGCVNLDLRNTTAHAITVALPQGTTYTIANNTGGTITVTVAPVTTTIAGSVSLLGAEIRVYDLDNVPAGSLGTELAGIESCAGATFDFNAQASNSVWIQVMKNGYVEFGQQFTVPTAASIFTAILVPDTNT